MPPQTEIRGYELLERIGVGAASNIYRARRTDDGEIVAIKHVVAEDREDRKYLRHCENEYRVLRSLRNGRAGEPPKGIVKVFKLMKYGFLRRRKERVLVMEYLEGLDLRRERRYPMGQLVDIFTRVTDALAALHARGLIHGDIKPENIVVGPTGQPTLVDFGFSCRAGDKARSIRGTRDYMAPEQVNMGRLTEKTDLYNLGATMYFVFTGRFVPALIAAPGDTAHFIGARDMVEVSPMRTFNPSIPAILDEIVMRCVHTDALLRPSCVEEVREVLVEVSKRHYNG